MADDERTPQDNGPDPEASPPDPAPAPTPAGPAASDDAAGGDDPTPEAGAAAEAALEAARAAVDAINDESAGDAPAAGGDGSAGEAAAGSAAAAAAAEAAAQSVDLPDLLSDADGAFPNEIDLLSDVNLNVKIELGRTEMLVEDVLRLNEGSVVELDKLAGDPVDIYVNNRHVARGEVLVLNDNFCVRVNEILDESGAVGAEGRAARPTPAPPPDAGASDASSEAAA